MPPIMPISGRCQSRGFAASDGRVYGTAAARGFDEQHPGDRIEDHAAGAFRRMEEILAEAGLDRRHVVFVQIYLHNVDRDIEGFNAVWRDFFKGLSPGRCCVGASLLMDLLVEMTFIADPDTHHQTAS